MNPKFTLAVSLLVGGISLTAGAQSPSPAATSAQVKPNQRCDIVSATGFTDGSREINPGTIKLKCKEPVSQTTLPSLCHFQKRNDDKPDELTLYCQVQIKPR